MTQDIHQLSFTHFLAYNPGTFQNLQSVITSKRYWLDNKKRSALHCVPIVGDIGIEPMTPSV